MERKLFSTQRTCTTTFETLPTLANDDPQLRAWLVAHRFPSAQWLLAHTTSGVVWGKLQQKAESFTLLTSSGRFGDYTTASLVAAELQSCRLFGKGGELLLWHDGKQLAARL